MTPDLREQLLAELAHIEEEQDRLRSSDDPSKIKTQMELAGLVVNWWAVQVRLADSISDRIDADRRRSEAIKDFERLSKRLSLDLLPEIQEKIAEWDRCGNQLEGLS